MQPKQPRPLKIDDIRDIRQEGDIVFIHIRSDIDMTTVPIIQEYHAQHQHLFDGWKYVILNMKQAGHVDSAALALFINCFGMLRAVKGRIFLVQCSETLKSMLRIASLEDFFKICDSEQDAIRIIQTSIC